VPFDREDTLKKAEKLLRTGRLDAAIVEYEKVVDEQPGDWATTNTLGDLYVRAGQSGKAAAQYTRIADHFMREGFYPRAAALYKKLLKLNPEDEASQLNLAELSQRQGLLADAKAHLNAIASRRRSRGDKAGAAEMIVRLGSVDPADFDARSAAARMLAEMGDEEGAAQRFRAIADDLLEKGREPEALDALREAIRHNPYDQSGRVRLARAAIAAADVEGARTYLDRDSAGDDPVLLTALIELELKSERFDAVRELLPQLLALGPDQRQRMVDLAWTTAETNPDAAFVLLDAVADAAAGAREYGDAAAILQEFVARVPNQIAALRKLIELCVDGGLEATMYEAQAHLADAFLASGRATEARVIAEDLVAREPWERTHIDRFRRALVMLKVPEPDSLIAERLSGQAPFMATDLFAEVPGAPGPDAAEGESASTDAAVDVPPYPQDEIPTVEQVAPQHASGAPSEGPLPDALEPPVPPRRKKRGPSVEIDLTNALGDLDAPDGELDSPPQPADGGRPDASFGDFRQEVQRQSGADQSAQHMTLARTYLEMGMQEEALGSLHVASRTPRFRFEAASLLGRIFMKRGEITQAIEWLERAAEAPAPDVQQGRELLYDLGTLVEQSGETARALAIFLELQSEAGDYRDVAARIERLARVETGG
jgi:tetratricopeptide (TPR) repeat protein